MPARMADIIGKFRCRAVRGWFWCAIFRCILHTPGEWDPRHPGSTGWRNLRAIVLLDIWSGSFDRTFPTAAPRYIRWRSGECGILIAEGRATGCGGRCVVGGVVGSLCGCCPDYPRSGCLWSVLSRAEGLNILINLHMGQSLRGCSGCPANLEYPMSGVLRKGSD